MRPSLQSHFSTDFKPFHLQVDHLTYLVRTQSAFSHIRNRGTRRHGLQAGCQPKASWVYTSFKNGGPTHQPCGPPDTLDSETHERGSPSHTLSPTHSQTGSHWTVYQKSHGAGSTNFWSLTMAKELARQRNATTSQAILEQLLRAVNKCRNSYADVNISP